MKYKKIEIAPSVGIEQYEDIAEVFFKRIFDMEYSDILITDESSLTDFFDFFDDRGQEKERVLKEIKKAYGVDVSDLEKLLLVDVFQRIRIIGEK